MLRTDVILQGIFYQVIPLFNPLTLTTFTNQKQSLRLHAVHLLYNMAVAAVLVVNPPDQGSATVNLQTYTAVTTPSLGKLTSSLPVLDTFIFARNS